VWVHLGAQAVVALERADPVPGGGSLAEVRVVQPVLHLSAGGLGPLRLTAVLNLEGATIPEGELALGNWGEGFVDRRHPHTYLHELIVTAGDLLGARPGTARLSLSAGKGFAPFGTDDPMVRPFLRYPVNHHLAQILERAVDGHPAYVLAEWARTSEADGFFVFHSVLVEGAWSTGPHRLQYRFERTERPEEERVARFRSLRPHLENSILGTTRWTTHTAGYEVMALRRSGLEVRPLAEVTYARVAKVGGGLIDVEELYGGRDLWSLALGVRISAGGAMHRMGRYGAAEDDTGMTEMTMHDHQAAAR
jgi:hypothetical protein